MPFVDGFPAGTPLIVRYTEVFLRNRYDGGFWLSGAAAAVTIVGGAITLGYSTFGGLALLLVGAGFVALAVQNRRRRRKDRSAAALVANTDGVWLALETAAGERILHLPWQEITRVRRATWSGPAGRHVQYVCFDAPAAPATGIPGGVADHFGTPFVVSETGKDTDVLAMLHKLAPLANAAGVEVDPALPV